MYEVIIEVYGWNKTMGRYETLEAVHEAIEREGCSWEPAVLGDADYDVYFNGEWIEGWC